ncbi:PQQ-binding-like beta-propeller repeat protein [Pseudomonadota bacterium]
MTNHRNSTQRRLITPESFTDESTGFSGWRARLQTNRAIPTPAVLNGRLFVGGGFGSYDFYALDAKTGFLDWHFRTGDDGPTSAVLSEGCAIFNTESCTLEVVEMKSGSLVWDRWLGDPLLGQPAVDAGRVFIVYPQKGDHFLGAFRLSNGDPLWDVRLEHDVITAPIAIDGKVYASTLDGTVWAIDSETGRVDWTRQMQATSAPWIYNGEVYVAHRENAAESEKKAGERERTQTYNDAASHERTSKFDARSGDNRAAFSVKGAPYLDENWGSGQKASFYQQDANVGFSQAPAAAKLDISSKLIGESMVSRTWRFQGSRPVVVDGVLYDTTGDCLEARDPRSGELRWKWNDAQATAGERRLTPPAVANGRIWAGTWDGRLISWDAASGQVRWSARVGAPCHWQPVVSNGRVFAGLEDGTLVALETGDSLDDGWPMWGGGSGHNGTEHRT